MAADSVLVAVLLGVVQGVLEWLPISSEGNLALALSLLGTSPAEAVRYALFLHLGTAVSATVYYRDELGILLGRLPDWRPVAATAPEHRELTFLAVATLVSGVVGVGAYLVLIDQVSALSGGAFVALIGALLVVTGAVQRLGSGGLANAPESPSLLDALLVGVGQGFAILPGVSRSGTTVGLLLLRGQPGEAAFRLSFLLAIPASVGAATLVLLDSGAGFAGPALLALATSAIVGYATIDLLMTVVRRVPFWAVCVALGVLAMVGGLLVGVT